jgi:superfamily I DNA/RNA helicase
MNTFNGTLDIYLASAGTGKTGQLMNIINNHLAAGVPIDRIAFVTFTRKGAEVARLRTAERFGYPLDKLKNFRTIHSMAFRGCEAQKDIMMDYPKYKDFGDKAGYNFGTLGLNTQEGTDWNEMKDQQLVTVEQLYRNNRPYCEKIMEDRVDYADLVRYIQLYNKYKKTFGYKDFTDLLEDYIQSGVIEDVDVVCLDEMQDSSLLQWQLVFQAFSKAQHIYVAADIKQCIFSYAGASPETVMNLRGKQHVLELSYRVPSTILSFAQNIVNEMQMTDHSHCKAVNEGGVIEEITCVDELTEQFDINKTYFFLARNKKFFKSYEEWCRKNGITYCIKGEPVFTDTDKIEFREGRTADWDPEKLDFARYCFKQGTFYMTPRINISTIHTVKGDEADVVVLMSDISKAVASQLEVDEDSEHRVFYVAVTRAREKLIVIQPQTKLYYPYLF